MEHKNNTEEKIKQDKVNQISRSNKGKHIVKARSKSQILVAFQCRRVLFMLDESTKTEQQRTKEEANRKIKTCKQQKNKKTKHTNKQINKQTNKQAYTRD